MKTHRNRGDCALRRVPGCAVETFRCEKKNVGRHSVVDLGEDAPVLRGRAGGPRI